ncbi:MAG TPA: diacylglycerol kinase family protein [Candidatus Saccharimonadales bacterium]|jgi:diacylglycerol kinase family enzyme
MERFDHIAIIYNPLSSGNASVLAKRLANQVSRTAADIGVRKATLIPTKHMRHAVELAYDNALNFDRPLIVSVSGDGGYNEVINGAMNAKHISKHARPVVAVVGAGNANDHKRVMRSKPLINLIKHAEPRSFDLVHIEATAKDFKLERYAHSYIGLGITPEVAHDLNKNGKGFWKELRIVFHTFRRFQPFEILHDKRRLRLNNLIFANINEMAKIVKLDDKNTVHDDKFEVIALKHHNKLHMLFVLVKAAIVGFKGAPSYQTYRFQTTDAMPIQLDGEVEQLPAKCRVTVRSVPAAIDSLF